jgi:hypothetical protein
MSTIRIKGDTSGYIDLSAGSNDGALDISSSVTGAPVRTHSDLELETGGIHVKNPAGIEGLIVDGDTTNAGVSGRIVLKNSTDASSVYYSNTLGWTFHTGTILGNTSGTQRMYITPQGYQRLPYQPAFSAWHNTGATITSAGGIIVWNSTHCNIGGHYSNSNGRFTAPVAGQYLFSWSTLNRRPTAQIASLYKNGSNIWNQGPLLVTPSTSGNHESTVGSSVIISMSASDYVDVRAYHVNGGDVYYGQGHANFTGYLLG